MAPSEISSRSNSGRPVAGQPTFLMCPPTLYDVSYVINPWMAGNVNRSSRHKATQQWQELHEALTSVARVELLEQLGWHRLGSGFHRPG